MLLRRQKAEKVIPIRRTLYWNLHYNGITLTKGNEEPLKRECPLWDGREEASLYLSRSKGHLGPSKTSYRLRI